MSKKWMERLQKHSGAISFDESVYADVIRTPSPSLNFVFGKTWGLPKGYTMALWGPQKGGKSLIIKSFIKQLHEEDPDAIAVIYDTEARWRAQMTLADFKLWGIDKSRLLVMESNEPEEIFDDIETRLWQEIQDGAPIRFVAIDSASMIRGRRSLNAKTINTQQIGDQALTIKDGLSRILKIQRRAKIAMVLTCHVTAEMDPIEIMRGNKFKMGSANALKHYSEYFVFVEADKTKDARETLLGEEFKDETRTDMMGNAEKTAHKIRVCMKDSSLGPKGRVGEFTYDYQKGIINTHEEVFLLGVNRAVIEHPNNIAYSFGGRTWNGKKAMLSAIETEHSLRADILKALMQRDIDDVLGAPADAIK